MNTSSLSRSLTSNGRQRHISIYRVLQVLIVFSIILAECSGRFIPADTKRTNSRQNHNSSNSRFATIGELEASKVDASMTSSVDSDEQQLQQQQQQEHLPRHRQQRSLVRKRRYWGDELSSCIELHCAALQTQETMYQYIGCLLDYCPDAIIKLYSITQPQQRQPHKQ